MKLLFSIKLFSLHQLTSSYRLITDKHLTKTKYYA